MALRATKVDIAALAGSPPDTKKLEAFLSVLAPDAASRAVLASIVAKVRKADVRGGSLRLSFGPGTSTLEIEPATVAPDEDAPPDLARILEVIETANYGEPGDAGAVSLHDGTGGSLHALGEDGGLRRNRDGIGYAEDLRAPVDVGTSIYYLYEPKTQHLRKFDMDGGLQKAVVAGGAGAAFLGELAHALEIDGE